MTTDALTVHQNVPAMVAAYEEARRLITEGFALIAQARRVHDATFALVSSLHRPDLSVPAGGHCHHSIDESPEVALKHLRQQTWKHIIDRIGLKSFTSSARWDGIVKTVEQDKMPEPTMETINGFLRGQLASLDDIMRESVTEVFEWLRPRRGEYKRNSEEEVPRSVVLSGAIDLGFMERSFKVHSGYGGYSGSDERLLAMENVFNALDGKGQINKGSRSQLAIAIERCTPQSKRGETDLFAFSCHKNGNLHLTFRRLDLLEKLNQIAGGNRLRRTKTGDADLAVAGGAS